MMQDRKLPTVVEDTLRLIEAKQNRKMRAKYRPPVWRTSFDRRQWVDLLAFSGVNPTERPAAAAWFLWLSFDALGQVGRQEKWEPPENAPPQNPVAREEDRLYKIRDALATIQDSLDTIEASLPNHYSSPSSFGGDIFRELAGLKQADVVPPAFPKSFAGYGPALARAHRQRSETRQRIATAIANGRPGRTVGGLIDCGLSATAELLARLPCMDNKGGRPAVDQRRQATYELASVFDIYHPNRINDGELKRFVQAALTLAVGEQDDGSSLVSINTVSDYLREGMKGEPPVRFAAWHRIWYADEAGLGYLGEHPDIPLPWRRETTS